jgi:hypothetical protein
MARVKQDSVPVQSSERIEIRTILTGPKCAEVADSAGAQVLDAASNEQCLFVFREIVEIVAGPEIHD